MNIRYFEGQLDRAWRELAPNYQGFDKPVVIPGRALGARAPMYMRRYIDMEADSYYVFVKGNPLDGNVSREAACSLFKELFVDQLGMGSSMQQPGMPIEQAVSMEVLPAQDDTNYQRYYDEQMDLANQDDQQQDSSNDQSDDDVIDLDDNGNVIAINGKRQPGTAVGTAQTTAVGMPKPIFYAVCTHVSSAGNQLGYNRGDNRLGRRGSSQRYLREAEEGETLAIDKLVELTPTADKSKLYIAKRNDGIFQWFKCEDDSFNTVFVGSAKDSKDIINMLCKKYDLDGVDDEEIISKLSGLLIADLPAAMADDGTAADSTSEETANVDDETNDEESTDEE